MIRNIRHIQIKKIAYCPNLFIAIITFESHGMIENIHYDESDDIEYIKFLESQKSTCPPCDEMDKKRRRLAAKEW